MRGTWTRQHVYVPFTKKTNRFPNETAAQIVLAGGQDNQQHIRILRPSDDTTVDYWVERNFAEGSLMFTPVMTPGSRCPRVGSITVGKFSDSGSKMYAQL